MPRPRQPRPESAPAAALPTSQANPKANVVPARAGHRAEPPSAADSGTQALTPVATAAPLVAIGVGLDTARYGHHASFLASDLQDAEADLDFVESGAGYQ
jgi:hypothetical protein